MAVALLVIVVSGAYFLLTPKCSEIHMILKSGSLDFTFSQIIRSGAKDACQEEGVEFVFKGTDSEDDLEGQLLLLEESIKEEPDVILLSAIDPDSALLLVEEAESKGTKIIWIDSGFEDDGRGYVGTNNYTAAQNLAKEMAQKIDGKGEIVVLSQSETSSTANLRKMGFIDEIQNYPEVEIVEIVEVGDDIEKAEKITEELIEKYPDLKGIYATNAIVSEGVISACRQNEEQGEIIHFAFDALEEQVDGMEDGFLDGTVLQLPYNMGYEAVKLAVEERNASNVENIYIDAVYIEPTDLSNTTIQKMIFPFVETEGSD